MLNLENFLDYRRLKKKNFFVDLGPLSYVWNCSRAEIAQSTLKARDAINVGIAAAKSNFPGWRTPSLK